MTEILENTLVNKMMKDMLVRTSITKESFLFFFHFYYAHYVKYQTADFQKEIIHYLEKSATENLYVVAFRGSGKSTMVTTAYPIWAILGKQQKKFCLIFCQTKTQAKQHMMNIRTELEGNELLKKDLGPFQEESDEWGSYSLVFSKCNARITVASTEQSIRGVRHNEHRPDLIICDDVEDVQSTKTRESRDKTYNWLRGEIVPTGDKNTRLIIVGNLLHEDSLLMRIKNQILANKAKGVFKEYPLLDSENNCLWTGKYTCEKDIEDEKMRVANDIAWQREYLLHIVSDTGRVVHPEWLHYYSELPQDGDIMATYVGVDLAISEKDSADRTAMVTVKIYQQGEKRRAYILPNPFNDTIGFPKQIEQIKQIARNMHGTYPSIFVEKVAYQDALIQQLQSLGIKVEGIPPHGDKRERLALTTAAIQEGLILFPKKGAEELISQIVDFGVEKHDDLADAFSLVTHQFITFCNQPACGIEFISFGRPRSLRYFWEDDDY